MRFQAIRIACRIVASLALSIWIGGFTFYSAAVIPVLHESLGVRRTGFITQRVTDTLNLVGIGATSVLWLLVWLEKSGTLPLRARRRRALLVGATSTILLFLVVLHRIMDQRLAIGAFERFYPLHRWYLIASTVQWFVNVVLVASIVVGANIQVITPKTVEVR